MKNNNFDNNSYLEKIYEQNERILQLLEQFIEKNNNENYKSKTKKDNIEKINDLSKKDRQIIELLMNGKLNKQIAHELDIAASTVEYHRANIMKKLEAKNIAQMIKMYLQWEDSI